MSKLSFCLEAVKLHDDDQAALTDAIEHYTRAGMPTEQAERAAIDDVQADVRAERQDLLTAAEAAAPAPATPEPEAKPPVAEPPAAAVQASAPRDVTPEGFYSQLVTAIDQAPMASMPASQWRQWLDSNAAKLGVKKEEIEWSGILDYLAMRGKDKLSRDSVANFVEQHGVQVTEVVLGAGAKFAVRPSSRGDWEVRGPDGNWRAGYDDQAEAEAARYNYVPEDPPKFDSPSYRLKGGENYREILLTLPDGIRGEFNTINEQVNAKIDALANEGINLADLAVDDPRRQEIEALRQRREEAPAPAEFTEGHWDQPNVIAHTRVSDHTDVDGARVLLLNEIQSDWAQKGRKQGFKGNGGEGLSDAEHQELIDIRHLQQNGVALTEQQKQRDTELSQKALAGVDGSIPKGPFVEDTKSWVSLVLKRAITLAAQEGHDKVAIVRGDQAASFFDLDKQVDKISYEPTDKGFYVNVMKDGRNIKNGEFTPSQLEDLVGKDIVARMQKSVGTPEESNPNSPDYEDLKGVRNLTGSDLRLEASGMRGFYDKIVPQVAADVLKKIGGKLTTVKLPQKVEDYERTARYEGPVHTFMDVQRMHLLSEKRGGDVYDNPLTGRREDYPINRVANSQELRVVVQHMREGKSFEQAILDPNISGGVAELFGGQIVRFDAGADVSNQVGFDITPAMREKLKTGLPLFSKNRAPANEDAQTREANFRRWSNDAPLVNSAQASTYAFKTGQKVVLEAFHGTKRPDRVGTVFQRKRATSGPMAFFTSAYASNKNDTSLANEDQQYATWFKYKPEGSRSTVDVVRAWHFLPEETKAKIAELAPRVTTDDSGENIILGAEGTKSGNGGYYVEETRTAHDRRGNPLKALVTAWLDSGSLYDQEEHFLKVLELSGFPVKGITYDSPQAEYPSVYKAFVFMQRPLVTSDIPQEVRDALTAAAKRDRSRAAPGGSDMWDKNTRTLREWVNNFNDPANTSTSYVWTSIPDKVTDMFKSLGYDGIIDWSGKGGGHQHPVYIPFEETQVKSATGNKGTFDREKKDIRFSKARDVTETPEFKRWFGDSKVVDAQGKPLVVYHGTSTGIQEFTLDRAGQNGASSREAGIFFTDEPSLADQYANEAAMRQRLKAADRYWPKNLPPRGDANAAPTVMPVYLSLQNPAKLDMKGKTATPARTAAAIERAKEKGRDGLIIVSVDDATYGERSQHSGSDTIYVAFHPEQIKSAIGNSGAFSDSPNISLARARPSNAPQSWTMPDDTYLDKKLFEWQDSKIDLKRAQEAITANGAAIREQFDTRLAETNYAGRAAFRTETFAASEVQPLLTTMRAGKVSFEEIGDFLLARHAPERNAQIRAINPAIPDGGAGANSQGVVMTDAAARAFLAAIPAARRTVLDTVARRVDAITAGTRNLLVAEGLEKQATMNTWQRLYPNYVPLFKDEAEDSVSHPQGMGFNVRGATSKRATGSTEKVTNVIAHVVQQREAAITRAEKNRVGLSLYGLALTHPNPEFWAVINPGMSATRIRAELQSVGIDPATWANMDPAPTIRSVDPVTNKVVDRTNPMYRNMDSAIVLRVNGEDRVMLFNERNDRALRLAQDMKNMDGLVALNLAATMVGRATRWFAAVNTQYNLAFGLVNFTRDVIAGTVHLTNTDLRYDKAKVLGNLPAALVGIARDVRGDPNRTLWSDLWVRFQDAGGRTGYRELFAGPNSRAAALEKELRSLDRKAPGKAVHAVLDFLDDFNVSMENATRLSAFKAGLDRGLSEAASARIARELTVDFNRKGRTGRALNPIYAFLNASIQGVERTGRAIAGPAGTRIILGGLALGVVQALILAAAGYEPDDLEQYVKARAFIIPTGGDKRYFQIPLPPGLNVIPNTSRVLTELAMTGGRDWKKKLPEALGQIVGALNVFSGESNLLDPSSALRTAMPTVGDMFVDLSTGKNWMGRPIEKAPYTEDDNRPGYQRSREATLRSTTGKGYLAAAQGANWATGGTAYEQGLWSPTPEKLRYLMQQVGGGVARELEKVVDSTVAATGDEPIEPRALPMASRFVGHVDQEHVGSQQFYDAEHRLKRIESSFRAADKAGDAEAVEKMVAKYPTELAALQTLHDVDKQLGALTKEAVETITDRKRLAEIDKERAELMGVFNTTLKQLETDQAKAAATKSGSSR